MTLDDVLAKYADDEDLIWEALGPDNDNPVDVKALHEAIMDGNEVKLGRLLLKPAYNYLTKIAQQNNTFCAICGNTVCGCSITSIGARRRQNNPTD